MAKETIELIPGIDTKIVLADVMTMQRKCLPCILKENLEREE